MDEIEIKEKSQKFQETSKDKTSDRLTRRKGMNVILLKILIGIL
jgi:hypothetical protein